MQISVKCHNDYVLAWLHGFKRFVLDPTVLRALSTGFHLRTGEQEGSNVTQRSSRRTAAQKLPF